MVDPRRGLLTQLERVRAREGGKQGLIDRPRGCLINPWCSSHLRLPLSSRRSDLPVMGVRDKLIHRSFEHSSHSALTPLSDTDVQCSDTQDRSGLPLAKDATPVLVTLLHLLGRSTGRGRGRGRVRVRGTWARHHGER